MSHPRQNNSRDSATWIALFGLLAISVGLLFLTAMVLPQIFFLVLVVFGFIFLISFHYLVWGRWLAGKVKPEEEEPD